MKNYTLQNNQKSIHIVVFTGGLYPKPELTEIYWKNCAAGNPDYIIAADSGLEVCLEYKKYFSGRYDFSPRKIIGDFDSISSQEILSALKKDIVESFVRDKDFTDTELALRFAYQKAAEKKLDPFITLVGGDGGRIDHLLSIVNSFRSKFHPDSWLCAFQQISFLKKNSGYFLHNLELMDNVSFVNVFGKGRKILTEGLKWESRLFAKGFVPSISNRISEENFKNEEPVFIKPKASGFMAIIPLSSFVLDVLDS